MNEQAEKITGRLPKILCGAIVLLGLIVIALTVSDYGICWDEAVQTEYGERVLRYFQSGGEDKSCNELLDLRIYGPLFELTSAMIYQHLPAWKFEIRHALTAVCALLAIPALLKFGRTLGSAWIGVFAGVALVCLPRYYGHAFINSKDIPFACGMAWSMYSLAKLLTSQSVDWKETFLAGLIVGLTIAVRPGGVLVLLVFYVAINVYVDLYVNWRQGRKGQGRKGQGRRALSVKQQLVIVAIAWLIMVAFWPWAHDGITHPALAIGTSNSFHTDIPVLFEGKEYMSTDLPWYYLPKYLLITVPVPILAVALIGVVFGVVQAVGCWHRETAAYVVALVWLVLPPVLCAIRRPTLYDGMRHFMFLMPAIGLWFGVGACWIISRMPRSRVCRIGAVTAMCLAAVSPVGELAKLHPYQMTYFNQLVGGLAGANGRYETDYWLTSYKEAAEWVASQSSTASGTTTRVLVGTCDRESQLCAAHFLREGFEVGPPKVFGPTLPPDQDFYIGSYRYGLADHYPESPILKTFGRRGTVFAVVRGRAPVAAETVPTVRVSESGQRRR